MKRLLFALLLVACARDGGTRERLILGTTFTIQDSGLLDSLTAAFGAAHPQHDLQMVVAGSGEVLQLGARGDVDVLLTHSPAAELELVRLGTLLDRRPVMHNDFVLLGPPHDPAQVGDSPDAKAAFARLHAARAPFVSRGDDSGTHVKELSLWGRAGVASRDWEGYIEAAAGMADALRIADQRRSYILADRATFLKLREQLQLTAAFEGDTALVNQYSALRSSKARNTAGALAFEEWITSASTQAMIARFGGGAMFDVR